MDNTALNHGLSDQTVTAFTQIFEKFSKIDSVILYGSRAKGNYHKGSDIDLAISAPDMNDNEFAILWDALDNLDIIYKIDCLHLERMQNQDLYNNIQNQGVIFYNK